MTINLLDVVPYPRDYWEHQQRIAQKEKMEQEKAQVKEEKLSEKAKKKAEKAKRKAEKKAEKAKKKAEKKAKKNAKDLSATPVNTVATVQVPENQPVTTQAAMPTGVVLAVCASLLICFGSAWFYRRFNSDAQKS